MVLRIFTKQNAVQNKKFSALFLILIFILQIGFVSTDGSNSVTDPEDLDLSSNEVVLENEDYSIEFDQLSGWDENFGYNLHEFETYENYLFVQDYYKGFRVYDITDPSNPEFLTDFDYPFTSQCSGGPTLDFVIVDDKLFITDYCTDLHVLDISNIYNPVELYSNSDIGYYQFYVFNDLVFAYVIAYQLRQFMILDPTSTTGLDIISNVTLPSIGSWYHADFKDNLLYVHSSNSFDLLIYNLTIIDQPVFVGQTIESEYASVTGLAISENYVIASLFSSSNHSGLTIYNITDPFNPFIQSNITTEALPGLGSKLYDMVVKNEFCYLADPVLGLQIVDLRNLSDVLLVETIDFVNTTNVCVYLTSVFALSSRFEIRAFDISDPLSLTRISIINLGHSVSKVLIEGDYLFTTNRYDGFYIFSIQPDYSLIPIYHFKDLNYEFANLAVNQDLLILVTDECQLFIFDITTISNPVSLANYTLQVNTRISSDIYIKNNLLFVNSHFYDAWEIIDITNPSSPVHLSSYLSPNYLETYSEDMVVDPDRDLVYYATTKQLEIVNVSDPTNPTTLTIFAPTDLNWIHLVYVNYTLFASAPLFGISVFDVTNPLNPQLLTNISFAKPYWLNYHKEYLYVISIEDLQTHIFHWQSSTSELIKIGKLNNTGFTACFFSGDIVALPRGSGGLEIYSIVITHNPLTTSTIGLNIGLIIVLFTINLYFLNSPVLNQLRRRRRKR